MMVENSGKESSGTEMVPFLHLTDEKLVERTAAAMRLKGTAASFRPLGELTPEEIPPWVETSKGGWVLFLDRSKMESGATRLGTQISLHSSDSSDNDDEE